MNWQSIITAPRDGSWILAYWNKHQGSMFLLRYDVVRWIEADSAWCDDDGNELNAPTHWMPLPDPPKENP
jgi:hypothetical protein